MKLRLYFIAWFLLLALLLTPHMAAAQVTTVGVHGVTRHDPGLGANDVNPGVFAIFESGFLVGTYYNSHFRQSFYAGWTTPEWYRMRLSFVGVTGYFAPVTPIIMPSLKVWQGDKWSAWVSGSPFRLSEDGQSVLHLSFAWSLK